MLKLPYTIPTVITLAILLTTSAFAQQQPAAADSAKRALALDEVTITGAATHFAAPVDGTTITSGRRNEVIKPREVDANLAQNNARQVLGRVPGLMVWENDGSGQQINIATRGLSPNRSWEFNVRQNGYDISSDPFGYPEAYYNPPLEAVERIQLLRGGAGLQFGPQFGGLLNYELRRGARDRKIEVETSNTVGSNGLLNSYNAVGGTVGRLNYYAYYRRRQGGGWRANNRFSVHDLHTNLHYRLADRLTLGAELTYMTYQIQQPGGLTDAQVTDDARQSFRSRNWLSTPWLVPALTLDYQASERTRFTLKTFGLVGERNSVGFVIPITVLDTVNRRTGQFAARQVDRDTYCNLGSELRLTHELNLVGDQRSTLAAGLRLSRATTARQQRGVGSTGADYDLNLISGGSGTIAGRYAADLNFTTTNAAAFAELLLRLSPRLSLTPGLRAEWLRNTAGGYLSLNANGSPNALDQTSTRRVLLYGLGTEYQVSEHTNLYANYSRAFRPVLFGDLVPPATTDVIDPNLKDARGYTAEIGYRGQVANVLRFDVGYYYLSYQDRIGLLRQALPGGAPGQTQQLRTNLGDSRTHGLEAYAEFDLIHGLTRDFSLPHLDWFVALSLLDARYTSLRTFSTTGAGTNTQIVETSLQNKEVENAPRQTLRSGLTFAHKGLSLTTQVSRVGAAFADAGNTATPTANAQAGRIPAYTVTDLSATYKVGPRDRYRLSAGLNNLFDARYFTRRAGGYPGPGALPADGRTWYLGLGLTL